MRILYDGEIYRVQVAGGINRYFASLIGRLPQSFRPTIVVANGCGVNKPVHPRLRIRSPKEQDFQHIPDAEGLYSRLKRRYPLAATDSSRFNLAHPTYYQLVTRHDPSGYRCPLVLTVWDMIHELFAEQMDPEGVVAEIKRKAIQAADAIICISENTRKDLLERYPAAESKVRVTALAPDLDIGLTDGPELVPSRPYFLYVGSRSAYKNFDGLVGAFAKAVSARPEMALCVVGAPFDDAEQRFISVLKISGHIENYGYVTNKHLKKLYRHSLALVYPSLYEGFGIPPLEAMTCETAVVASDVASIPQVVGDAALLFDPRLPDDLTDSLLVLFDSPTERERLIAKGRERVKLFSWDKTVTETLKIYREVSNYTEDGSIAYCLDSKAPKTRRRKRFSIITPTFNSGHKLEETIKSVLSQNEELFEYIIVDGESTDETLGIIKKYEGRIEWISEKDRGVYDAMNKGIKMAQGDYLYFLGAGDQLRSTILEKVERIIPDEPLTFFYGKVFVVPGQCEYLGEVDEGTIRKANICHQAIFFHRTVFDVMGVYDLKYRVLADWAFNIRCFEDKRINKVYVPEVIADFEGGGFSATTEDTSFDKDFRPNYEMETLSAALAGREQALKVLSTQLAKKDRALEALSAELAEKVRALEKLSAELAEKDGALEKLSAELAEKDGALEKLSANLAELNRALQSQKERDEERVAVLSVQLLETETQLRRIANTFGWRLLSYYGPIKYRFLLPFYRLFGKDSAERTQTESESDNPPSAP